MASKRGAFTIATSVIVAAVAFENTDSVSLAAEGTTAAGPIGGTDIRSALLPPPGVYGGAIGFYSAVPEIRDGTGRPASGLDAVNLNAKVAAPFFVYVPNVQVLGGSIGLFGVFPSGQECGRVVSSTPPRCTNGFGDPYFEFMWSRSFGQLRPSRHSRAFPILEGLTVAFGLGVVIPVGRYDARLQRSNGLTLGDNIVDVAPSAALTYTTQPLIAEGTEFSAKIYWNQYSINSLTRYTASPLVDVDFAVTEHVNRFQLGLAGVYLAQVGRDKIAGVTVSPDGRRLEYMALGGILNYDMPEYASSIRVKALTAVLAHNSGASTSFTIGFAKKLY